MILGFDLEVTRVILVGSWVVSWAFCDDTLRPGPHRAQHGILKYPEGTGVRSSQSWGRSSGSHGLKSTSATPSAATIFVGFADCPALQKPHVSLQDVERRP
jgi:hypothetical protein